MIRRLRLLWCAFLQKHRGNYGSECPSLLVERTRAKFTQGGDVPRPPRKNVALSTLSSYPLRFPPRRSFRAIADRVKGDPHRRLSVSTEGGEGKRELQGSPAAGDQQQRGTATAKSAVCGKITFTLKTGKGFPPSSLSRAQDTPRARKEKEASKLQGTPAVTDEASHSGKKKEVLGLGTSSGVHQWFECVSDEESDGRSSSAHRAEEKEQQGTQDYRLTSGVQVKEELKTDGLNGHQQEEAGGSAGRAGEKRPPPAPHPAVHAAEVTPSEWSIGNLRRRQRARSSFHVKVPFSSDIGHLTPAEQAGLDLRCVRCWVVGWSAACFFSLPRLWNCSFCSLVDRRRTLRRRVTDGSLCFETLRACTQRASIGSGHSR